MDSRPGRCEGHSPGSLSGVPLGSGWLPEFSCSSIHKLTSAPWLIPSRFGVEAGAHVPQCHSVRHLCEQHPCLIFKFLLVSLMYLSPQSLHGTSYTTSFWFSVGIFSFTCTSKLLMVLCGLNTVLTPSGAHTFSNA